MKSINKQALKHSIAPSLLAANPLRIEEEIESLQDACSILHLDIMDGHYVPNMNGSTEMVKALRKRDQHILDVHLMVTDAEHIIDMYVEAGADIITFHQEVVLHQHRYLQYIRQKGILAGISLNPGTPLSVLEELLPSIDMVLLMSVNPGYGGQKFIPESLDKIRRLRKMIDDSPNEILIEVDGGVNKENSAMIWEAGVDIMVAGSAVFSAENRVEACEQLLKR